MDIADLESVLASVTTQYQEFMKAPCKQGDAHKFSTGLQFVGAIQFAQQLLVRERGKAGVPSQPTPQTLGPAGPNLRG